MRFFDRLRFVIGLVLLFGGLDLTILLSHTSRLVGVLLIFAGIGIIFWTMQDTETKEPKKEMPDTLASSMVHFLTFRGRFRASLPIAGLMVMFSVLAFNILMADEFRLGSNDYVGLLLALVLISYNWVPAKYRVERDFALLFSIFLFVFLVIPTTLLELSSTTEDTNSVLTYYLLAKPTAGLAQLFGVNAISPGIHPTTGLEMYNYIDMVSADGALFSLQIGLSCSGLYSVAIFVSAFIAFVAVEYRKLDRNVALLLAIGILLAWIANIIRMTIIVIVGYYYGNEAMQWTHNNAGEFIFMAWVILFWMFMFKYFGVLDSEEEKDKLQEKGRCAICKERLSRSMPSRRCECGAISHSSCILTNENICPDCGVEFSIEVDSKI